MRPGVLGVLLFLTIHVGGVLCPHGGGNGCLIAETAFAAARFLRHAFLREPGSILLARLSSSAAGYAGAAGPVARPFFGEAVHPLFHGRGLHEAASGRGGRQAERMKYTTLLAACSRLVDVLRINELENNVILLPYGVSPREVLPFPPLAEGSPVKFYYVGRITVREGTSRGSGCVSRD